MLNITFRDCLGADLWSFQIYILPFLFFDFLETHFFSNLIFGRNGNLLKIRHERTFHGAGPLNMYKNAQIATGFDHHPPNPFKSQLFLIIVLKNMLIYNGFWFSYSKAVIIIMGIFTGSVWDVAATYVRPLPFITGWSVCSNGCRATRKVTRSDAPPCWQQTSWWCHGGRRGWWQRKCRLSLRAHSVWKSPIPLKCNLWKGCIWRCSAPVQGINFYGLPPIWVIFGSSMGTYTGHIGHIWPIYCPYMAHIWAIGWYMAHIWPIYEPYMAHIWPIYGPYVAHIYIYIYGFSGIWAPLLFAQPLFSINIYMGTWVSPPLLFATPWPPHPFCWWMALHDSAN